MSEENGSATNGDAQGSAAAYLEALKKKRESEVIPVPVPSGFTWMLRRPDIQGYILTGRMPQKLVEQFLQSAQKRGITPEGIQAKDVSALAQTPVDKDEAVATLFFMRELVQEACVKPRITEEPVGPDDIHPRKVDPEDFKFIFDWCLSYSGVAGIDSLQKFRGERTRTTAGSRSRGKKLRRKTIAATANN